MEKLGTYQIFQTWGKSSQSNDRHMCTNQLPLKIMSNRVDSGLVRLGLLFFGLGLRSWQKTCLDFSAISVPSLNT